MNSTNAKPLHTVPKMFSLKKALKRQITAFSTPFHCFPTSPSDTSIPSCAASPRVHHKRLSNIPLPTCLDIRPQNSKIRALPSSKFLFYKGLELFKLPGFCCHLRENRDGQMPLEAFGFLPGVPPEKDYGLLLP